MRRETGYILLPTRRRVDVAALARACDVPWRPWARRGLARAEHGTDGRVHLVVLRPSPDGVVVSVTGADARDTEVLAPIASRVRHALRLDSRRATRLRGTSAFEDAALELLGREPVSARALLALGRRCPVARSLRTFPDAATIAAVPPRVLARAVGSGARSRRLQALARGFAALAPAVPRTS
ncbi:MAG TPA: hypothetical protein VMS22_11955 [Candidatus Eisenbacteria bacterium]|nr:hypothetical protein [Candidatus Eisenbacteria bacterium]